MGKLLKFGLIAAFIVALIAYMFTYRVEFTERAVETRFGEATGDGQALGPGLHFKWPYPFESVTKYDTRIQLVDSRAETQQTADSKQVIIEAFCMWRVSDPLAFFRGFSNAGDRSVEHFREAEDILRDTLRSGLSETGQYELNDLFPSDGGTSKLAELEAKVLAAVRRGSTTGTHTEGEGIGLAASGIEVVEVGISRILLPQETSKNVIDRMRENRNRLVAEIESAGEARAGTIIEGALATASTIRSFAERRAREIEALGDIEAAPFIAKLDRHPEFAIFLENLNTMSRVMPMKTTWVLPSSIAGLEFIDPSKMSHLEPGQIPFSSPPSSESSRASAGDNDGDEAVGEDG